MKSILPRLIGSRAEYEIRILPGYDYLKRRLPERLRGYKKQIDEGDDIKILVLVDEDRIQQGCHFRKQELENIARVCGLRTKTSAQQGQEFYVVNRLAIEELEAWFFGDLDALLEAYPRVHASIKNKAKYIDPDQISGGTAEQLLRELQSAGYYSGISFLPKIEVADSISKFMDIHRNRSHSFSVFRQGVNALLA